METVIAASIGAFIAGSSALVAWLKLRRTTSGNVDTTKAETLWDILMARLTAVELEVKETKKAEAECKHELQKLSDKIERCQMKGEE